MMDGEKSLRFLLPLFTGHLRKKINLFIKTTRLFIHGKLFNDLTAKQRTAGGQIVTGITWPPH